MDDHESREPRWEPAPGVMEARETWFAAGVLAGGLLTFILLAVSIQSHDVAGLDRRILLMLRSGDNPADPIGPGWLESAVRDMTALGSRLVLGLMVAIATGYLALAGRTRRAGLVLAFTVAGSLVGEIAKLVIARPRPDLVPHAVEVLSLSFPSAHAMQASVVYLTLGAMLAGAQPTARLKVFILAVATVIAVMVGMSRVYLGVHWPSDVIAGWALGMAWATACWLLDRWLKARRLPSPRY